MDAKTEEALRASIAKWEGNAGAETPDAVKIGADECPLCALFLEGCCVGCPVFNETQNTYCGGTPYYDAAEAFRNWRDAVDLVYWVPSPADFGSAFRAEARKEADFLKSLLPEA